MEGAVKRALHHDEAAERKRQRKRARGLDSKAATPPMTPFDGAQTPVTRRASEVDLPISSPGERGDTPLVRVDVERGEVKVIRRRWFGLRKAELETEHEAIHPTLRDVNPLPAMWSIWKRPTNVIILLSSGENHCSGGSDIRRTLTEVVFRDPFRRFLHRHLHCSCHPRQGALRLQRPDHWCRHSVVWRREYGR